MTDIVDILIIGAGPAGLAVAARLSEPAPSALFTDEEHRRYCWINSRKAARLDRRSGKVHRPSSTSPSPALQPTLPTTIAKRSALVLDAEGPRWLTRWDRLFAAYGIAWLRSPLFFHVDPASRDGLLSFAHETDRITETTEIAGVVGRELSKHKLKKRQKQRSGAQPLSGTAGRVIVDERDRRDYAVPSRALFADHCAALAHRYNLDRPDLIQQARVLDIQYMDRPTAENILPHFEVHTTTGTVRAHAVVLAIGPPGIPPAPKLDTCLTESWPAGAVTHSSQLRNMPRNAGIVTVVGGGLTAAQLADLALRRGARRVHLVVRGKGLKQKPFDVDLEWVGKFANTQKARFWSAETDEERVAMIRDARGGGSVTPVFAKILKRWEVEGRLVMHCGVRVRGLEGKSRRDSGYADGQLRDGGPWRLLTEPPLDDVELRHVEHVYFATGGAGIPEMRLSAPDAVSEKEISGDEGMTAVQIDPETSVTTELMLDTSNIGEADTRPESSSTADDTDSPSTEPSSAPSPPEATQNTAPPLKIPEILRTLQSTHSIPWLSPGPAAPSALPVLTEELSWRADVPLFVTGALAALRVGPGAANLEGARLGAERCAWAIEDYLSSLSPDKLSGSATGRYKEEDEDDEEGMYVGGIGGRYESLASLDS